MLYMYNVHCRLITSCDNDLTSEWKTKKLRENNWEVPRPEVRVETDLDNCTYQLLIEKLIIGVLGTVSKDIEEWFAEIGVTCCLESLHRACLLGTARILRKVSDTYKGHGQPVAWCLRKTPASHWKAVFNNYNNDNKNNNNNNNNNTPPWTGQVILPQ